MRETNLKHDTDDWQLCLVRLWYLGRYLRAPAFQNATIKVLHRDGENYFLRTFDVVAQVFRMTDKDCIIRKIYVRHIVYYVTDDPGAPDESPIWPDGYEAIPGFWRELGKVALECFQSRKGKAAAMTDVCTWETVKGEYLVSEDRSYAWRR